MSVRQLAGLSRARRGSRWPWVHPLCAPPGNGSMVGPIFDLILVSAAGGVKSKAALLEAGCALGLERGHALGEGRIARRDRLVVGLHLQDTLERQLVRLV